MTQLHTPEAQDNSSLQQPRLFANVEPITDNVPIAISAIGNAVEWCINKIAIMKKGEGEVSKDPQSL